METTAATAAATGGGINGLFFIMIAFLIVFMFLSSRSQKKREAAQQSLIKSLQKGDQVILIGGVIGTIVGFNNETFEVKISENTKLSVLPSGIVSAYQVKNNAQSGGSK